MKRALIVLLILLASARADGDQTWTQNVHAGNHSLDGLPAAVLGTSPLRLQDLTLCTGAPLWVNNAALPFRCTTIGNAASGADVQAPLAPSDGTIVMPTAATIRVGAVPGTSVTGTPNTVAWFNGSGVLNSLTLSAQFALNTGTGTLSLAPGPANTAAYFDGTGTLSGAVDQVATVAALEALAGANYRDGARVRVTGLNDDFFLHLTSSKTVDHIAVASVSGLSGARWIRREGGRRQNWAAAYFVDPVGGSDQNDGLTSGTPLKTYAELGRRTKDMELTGTVTINPLSDAPDTDPITLDFSPLSGIAGVSITGSPTVAASGTIASSVAANYPGNQLNQITITGFNWAPYVGSVIRLQGTSGNSGTYSVVVKDLGSGAAQLGVRVVNNSAAGPTSFSAGQTIEVLSYPKVPGIHVNGASPLTVAATEVRFANSTGTIFFRHTSLASSLLLTRCVVNGGGTVGLSSTFGTTTIAVGSVVATTNDGFRNLALSRGSALVNNTSIVLSPIPGAAVSWSESVLWASPVNLNDYSNVALNSLTSPGIGVGIFGLTAGQVGVASGRYGFLSASWVFGASNDPSSWALGLSRTTRFADPNQNVMTEASSAGAIVGYFSSAGPTSDGNTVPLSFLQTVWSTNGVDGGSGPDTASTTNLLLPGINMFQSWVVTGTTTISSITNADNVNHVPTLNNGMRIRLFIRDGLTILQGGFAPTDFADIALSGGVNAVMPAGSWIDLRWNVNGWVEVARNPDPLSRVAAPTGTGFAHVTSGAWDAAARAVDVSGADATGILAAGRFPALTGPVTTTAGALATSLNLGAGGISGVLPLANQAGPTGTGFEHVTSGVRDGAARAVDVSGADITNQLKAASFPALTGPVTTPGGSLATALNLSSSGISGSLALSFLAQGGAATNQVVTWNGTAWVAGTPSLPPTGAAGGALTGTYPNPSIAGGVLVPSNFSAFPASTLFGNDQTSSAVPRTITLGSGLAFDPSGHVLNVTVAGGAPSGATYWVSNSSSIPTNGVNMGLLGSGVVQQSVASGTATPSVFAAGSDQMAFGAASGGGLQTDVDWTINPATHAITGTGSISLQGPVVTIGAWNGIGKYTSGVVGTATVQAAGATTAGADVQGPGAYITQLHGDGTATGPGNATFALSNIPNGTTAAGDISFTPIAAPGTPAAGHGLLYVDSTSLNLSLKNASGIVNHGIQTKAATAHNFLTAINDDGTSVAARPDYSDLTGAPSIFYQTLQRNSSNFTQRGHLNFSTDFSVVDASSRDATDVFLGATGVTAGTYTLPVITVGADGRLTSASGAAVYYQAVQRNSVGFTQRGHLNFSTDFSIADASTRDATDVFLGSTGVTAGTYTLPVINVGADGRITSASGASVFYQTVQRNSSNFTQRGHLNFSTDFSVVDASTRDATDVFLGSTGVTAGTYTNSTITVGADGRVTSASSGSAGAAFYQTVQRNSSNFTQRANLNFSADFSLADAGVRNATDVFLGTNVVTNSIIRQSAARSVVANPTNATANVQDLSAASGSHYVLHENGSGALVFDLLDHTSLTNNAVFYANLQNESPGTILGNPTGSLTTPQEISISSLTASAAKSIDYSVHYVFTGAGTADGWWVTSSDVPGWGFIAGAVAFEYNKNIVASSVYAKCTLANNNMDGTWTENVSLTRNGSAIGSSVAISASTSTGQFTVGPVSITGGSTNDTYGMKGSGSGVATNGKSFNVTCSLVLQ